MNKEQFKEILANYREFGNIVHRYYGFGVDLVEVDDSLVDKVDNIITLTFASHYSDLGLDWIYWFMYENDFGKNNLEAISDGKLICQTADELYDYIEQYKHGSN